MMRSCPLERKALFDDLSRDLADTKNEHKKHDCEERMKKVRITVMRQTVYRDLMEKYENPMENACDMRVGTVFVSENAEKPRGFCHSAWETLYPFVKELAEGGGNFFDGWMKEPRSAMLSCNDGFRPVTFYVEAIDG